MPQAYALAIYSNTNGLYSISKGDNRVFLSSRVGDNYAIPQIRYSDDTLSDLRDIEVIDSRIFLLAGGVGIDRVGLEDERVEAFDEVEQAIMQSDALGYGDGEYIYVLDNINDRVIVLTKQRESLAISDLVSQVIVGDLGSDMVEVVADRDKDLVIVATKSKIFTFARSSVI
jgi:hypothetical protein